MCVHMSGWGWGWGCTQGKKGAGREANKNAREARLKERKRVIEYL